MLGMDFFKPREKFLLLEIAPKRTSGVLVNIDEDKNITPEKFWDDFSFGKFAADPIESLRKKNIVVAVDPAFAVTETAPISVVREEGEVLRPLSLMEVELVLQKELARLSGEYRAKAGSRLCLYATEVVLVDVKLSGFRVDGHLVMNPLGFHAKKIEAVAELTFTNRQIFDDLREFFKAREGFFFTTLPKASVFALSRVEPPPLKLLFLRPEESRVFVAVRTGWGESFREVNISWRLDALFDAIAGLSGASPQVVLDIYDRYVRRAVSDGFSKNIDTAVRPALNELERMLGEDGLRGKIYVFSPLPFPANQRNFRRFSLEPAPFYPALERFGMKLRLADWPSDENGTFLRLAPLLEFYFGKTDSEINQRLRRRLHWLIQS